MKKTRKLSITATCRCYYNSTIEVPADLSLEDAIEYADKHLSEIPLGELDYVSNSDVLDKENCSFDDYDDDDEKNEEDEE